MELILTHEQADFDALAAMLAAYLLNQKAQPVLPNRMNRNVRKFLNLYGTELPFLETRDLPHENIQSITLVDTQSLVTLKGISKTTQVCVIDHHQEKPDFPTAWNKQIEKVGATTTLLVELLQENSIKPEPIQATLLLLGIYEDTGSLTYAATSVRDAKAVVYLLENGASLRLAAEYLNPALSAEQRDLADRLLKNAKTHTLQGKTIIMAQADASAMNEEISSVAHKLRDLLDPDALFLLVRTREGIRLIARSTSDAVNVAGIMSAFGGGGHERAASALLDADNAGKTSLDDISTRLLQEIQANIRPEQTVSKIMSKKPLLLTPETTLAEAERVMQRYGYEGYPVVESGKVVGLLTRRAVDRARSHKLNLKTGSLMESGNYCLQPDQSLGQVQDLMSSTGWGQVPVIDPSSEKIIGIVTRTDLLKNLMPAGKPQPKTSNYDKLIEKALSPCHLALLKKIIEISKQDPQGLYIVGGFVRDLILHKPSKDFDIVTEGDAIKLAGMISKHLGGRVVHHRRFGTAKWQIKDTRSQIASLLGCSDNDDKDLPEALDFISARTEFYEHPTALPTVETSSIKQDLHRRDFTINTLALRLDGHHFGELQDYWGGLEDLKKKQVKVLHSLSFVDDPTRSLRAVRFEQRFGFQIEKRTLQLMLEARENLKQISGDRIRHELDLIFKEADAVSVLNRLLELDLLTSIHPALDWSTNWAPSLRKVLQAELPSPWKPTSPSENLPVRTVMAYLVWFARLGEKEARAIAERLHFSNHLQTALSECGRLAAMQEKLVEMPPSEFSENLKGAADYLLYSLWCLSDTPTLQEKLVKYLTHWRSMEPLTSGEELKAMGIPPGPRYAEILKELKTAKLDGIIKDEAQEKVLLERLLRSF